jgi:DNA-binding PadR family transcriptional regulator
LRLKSPAYLLLGMLRLGATSGYSIKKAADASTHFFWPTSLAQVYPELAALERQGLVDRRDDSHGARPRSAYTLTSDGEQALLAWLRSDREAPIQFRDEGLLRLFFADALSGDERLALVQRLRDRNRNMAAFMQREGVSAAEVLESSELYFPAIAARFGAELWAFTEGWLARLEAEISETDPPEADAAARAPRGRPRR